MGPRAPWGEAARRHSVVSNPLRSNALEEAVLPCAIAAGLEPVLVLINDQKFTKTANCWGVENNSKGTNSNRVVVIRKPSAA